jgi:hypothetical protein
MGLIIKRDKGDKRTPYEVACDIDEDLARKLLKPRGKRCSLFCGDVECREKGCQNS